MAARTPSEQLAALQDRLTLLEGDRKVFYEKSQSELRANKAAAESLREENKQLKAELTRLQKEHGGRDGAPEPDQHTAERSRLEHQHNVLRQRHNALASANRDKEVASEKLADQLRDLLRDSKRVAAVETPLTRQVRILENRLDKAMIKYNEAMSIKTTYEQIVKRLKDERVSFDHQLEAIEETLKTKATELAELNAMAADAASARDAARVELAKAEALALQEQRAREIELSSRRALVKTQQDVMSRMDGRERNRLSVLEQARDELSGQQGLQAMQLPKGDDDDAAAGDDDDDDDDARADADADAPPADAADAADADAERSEAYAAALRAIKEATGVGEVDEIGSRITGRAALLALIETEAAEAQARLDGARAERERLRVSLEELKYAGGPGMGGRQEVEAQERKLNEATAAAERARARHERLAKAIGDMRTGVEHLSYRLETATRSDDQPAEPVTLSAQIAAGSAARGAKATAAAAAAAATDADLTAMLAICENRLIRFIDRTISADGGGGGGGAAGGWREQGEDANVRIRFAPRSVAKPGGGAKDHEPRSAQGGDDDDDDNDDADNDDADDSDVDDDDDDDDGGGGGGGGVVIDRESLKKLLAAPRGPEPRGKPNAKAAAPARRKAQGAPAGGGGPAKPSPT